MAKKQKKEIKFYQKLVLNRYLLKVFGAEKFDDIAQTLRKPIFENILNDGSTGFYKQFLKCFSDKMLIDDLKLQQYDLNIVAHLNAINEKRSQKIKLKYFQYLTLLFVEYYLDMYFNDRVRLLSDLNDFLADFKASIDGADNITPYQESDLNKIALWNATGSGKTLLMHINYHQYRYYAGNLTDGDSFILLTPKEGLSLQHIEDFADSNIRATIYDKAASAGFVFDRDCIQILENTKLGNKDGDKTVAVSRFGNHNVVFVDEGHRGASGDTWYKFRNMLCENGFSFEYSATFGQAVTASTDKSLENEYAKCIIFDYSYKFFYADGFGKDYNIINLKSETADDKRNIYLSACLLTYYQQKKLFIENEQAFSDFNLENPLFVFVGASVNAVKTSNGKKVSDVVDILLFFNEFVKNKDKSISNITRILDHSTGLLDALNRDIFRNAFPYIASLGFTPEEIYNDLVKLVFNCNTPSAVMHIENMKGVQGEISIRLGESEPFGLINVGDDAELMKLFDANGFTTGSIDFQESLFNKITKKDSKINLLIGSKKFTEGWNCWRVSTMGLMNVGRSEGSEIIQLFGRGVRLKGYGMSLMRSNAFVRAYNNLHIEPPKYITLMETLNVFGVRADYMNRFKEYLEEEGVPTNKDMPVLITLPVIKNRKFKSKKLLSLQVKEGLNYKKDAPKPILKLMPGIKITLDCYAKVQFESSKAKYGDSIIKEENKLLKKHFAMVSIDRIYLEMEKYKSEKLRSNLIITREGLCELLESNEWYKLLIPKKDLEITSFEDYKRFERIIVTLLKLYCDKFYQVYRNAWESPLLEYKLVDDTYENFIQSNEYEISVNNDDGVNEELITFLRGVRDEFAEARKNRQLIDFISPKKYGNLEVLTFDSSLYNPLLYLPLGSKEIVISPVALVESEKEFILALKDYVNKNAVDFDGKELFIIRNKAKKGVGFFETAGFYPDFIMWLVVKDKQYITFIEPHGMTREDISDEKVQLHTKIKDIQSHLGDDNVVLNSIILSPTGYLDLVAKHPKSEWNDNNVFFMDDEEYLKQMFQTILAN